MKKIPSLFARDAADPSVLTHDWSRAAAWVLTGEGVATRKWDGTAVLVRDGMLFARYDAKRGKTPPVGFVPAQDPDPNTGHHPGWVPATRPEDRWIREAHENSNAPHLLAERGVAVVPPGFTWTYEAVGPRIGGNRERLDSHVLIPHGRLPLEDVPRDHAGLVAYFTEHDVEGVVWWRDLADLDCDKIKITGAALGVPRRG